MVFTRNHFLSYLALANCRVGLDPRYFRKELRLWGISILSEWIVLVGLSVCNSPPPCCSTLQSSHEIIRYPGNGRCCVWVYANEMSVGLYGRKQERRTRETKDEKVDRLIRDLNRLQITIYLQVPLLDPTTCASYSHKTTHERQCMTERGKRCTESSENFPFAQVIEITRSAS